MNHPTDNPFPESRQQRQFKAWSMPISDKADDERPRMDRSGRLWFFLAAVVCLTWGAWLAYLLRGWLKTF